MDFHFDLTIRGLTRAEAEALLAFITEEAEYYHAEVGGGFAEVTEQDGAEAETADVAPNA